MDDDLYPMERRIKRLAESFPCLRNAPGISSWHAERLDKWAASGKASHGEACTAKFILAVWDSDFDWQCGKFDLIDAFRVWDEYHRDAFREWVRDPWWA
jgi:hypothetical protein